MKIEYLFAQKIFSFSPDYFFGILNKSPDRKEDFFMLTQMLILCNLII